jgi:hypothetical protein
MMARRQAIVRKSDGMIINVIISPDEGFPFDYDTANYEVIDAPFNEGKEIGNIIDLSKPNKPVIRDKLKEEPQLMQQLQDIDAQLQNPNMPENVKTQIQQQRADIQSKLNAIRQEREQGYPEALQEFEKFARTLKPKQIQ